MPDVLTELVRLSNHLGEPERDLAILGEGNTSATLDDATFAVKASGTRLATIDASGFVKVDFARALELLDREGLSDDDVRRGFIAAKSDPDAPGHPSVETAMHAALLRVEGVRFVGHTHPTAVNAITCSARFDELTAGRLFPDEIVVCGPEPVIVPYVDPGLPLAREIRNRVRAYQQRHGERPKLILMQNHGMIALGATPKEVADITAMAVKVARILQGACAVGGPRFLSDENVRRIHTRPDEHYRQKIIAAAANG